MEATQREAPARRVRLEVVRVLDSFRSSAHLDRQGHCAKRLATIDGVLDLLTACRTGRLGSHVYVCQACKRSQIGLNSCSNRHCACCGKERRQQWQEKMSGWELECSYFHVVFTLPHELNPLLHVNPRPLYKLLMRSATDVLRCTCQRELDCMPGMVLALHTWGQRMNLHVHCHVILTAGGLSCDGQHWRTIPVDHPSLSGQALSDMFRRMFLRRLSHRLTRDQLLWPTRLQMPADPQAVGLDSYRLLSDIYGQEQTEDEPVVTNSHDQSASQDSSPLIAWQSDEQSAECPPSAECPQCGSSHRCSWCQQSQLKDAAHTSLSQPRPRKPTEPEARLLAVLKRKTWMVDSQPPPAEYQGPQAIIGYLANYVTGTCISNSRLIDQSHGQVSIRVKDYKAGQVKQVSFEGEELVRRFVLHILPRGLRRMRYAGLYTPAGREQRLELARKLIASQKQGLSRSAIECPCVEAPRQEVEAESDEEKPPCKTCSRCQANMDSLGLLKGRETLQMIQLADDIDQRLTERTPLLRLEMIAALIDVFCRVWRLRDLPTPVRGLLRGRRLQSLECSALRALLERRLPFSMQFPQAEDKPHTSGVPPPEDRAEVIRATY